MNTNSYINIIDGYTVAWLWTPEGTCWHIYRPGQTRHALVADTFAAAIDAVARDRIA